MNRDADKPQKPSGNEKKKCDHPSIEMEAPGPYGQWSGDYVCTVCGATGPRSHFPKDAY